MQHVRDLDRVRHHGEVRNVEDVVGEAPGRRSGCEADGLAGLDETTCGAGDRLLLLELTVRLRLEARLVGAQSARAGRAAVHLVDETCSGEHVQVAPNRHVGHGQQLRQLADTHCPSTANLFENHDLALAGKHERTAQYSTGSNKARDPYCCQSHPRA